MGSEMVSKASRSLLSLIRSNRRALRARGLTAADLLMLESLAVLAPVGFGRVSVAALGRLTGTGRATALRHVRRLQAVGAIVRLGSAMMVNARSVLSWCADACKDRAARLKFLYLRRKSKLVCTLQTHRSKDNKSAMNMGDLGALVPLDAVTARAELALTYIPVHLRVHK